MTGVMLLLAASSCRQGPYNPALRDSVLTSHALLLDVNSSSKCTSMFLRDASSKPAWEKLEGWMKAVNFQGKAPKARPCCAACHVMSKLRDRS